MKPSTLKRIAISMALGIFLAAIITEAGYHFLKRENRAPQRVQLIIPAGAADSVAKGQEPPSIPADMTFVVGDTLVVVNKDSVDHQLGPLWIPSGTSASLNLDTEQNYAFQCSFQPTKVFGIDVKEPVTISTRVVGILFAGIPFGVLLSVYGTLLVSDDKKKAVE